VPSDIVAKRVEQRTAFEVTQLVKNDFFSPSRVP